MPASLPQSLRPSPANWPAHLAEGLKQSLCCKLTVLAIAASLANSAWANEVVSGKPQPPASASQERFSFSAGTPEAARGEQRHDRVLTDPGLLPGGLQTLLSRSSAQEALGTGGIPFSTKRVAADNTAIPTDYYPWRATGKSLMLMSDGGVTVCTASVIGPSLVVTAAHCIHDFGQQAAGFIQDYRFAPAFHEGHAPYGRWSAREWFLAKAYYDGSDPCEVRGVVCENDLAVIVMEPLDGQLIGDVVGQYRVLTYSHGVEDQDFSLASLADQELVQITQLGYPALFYDGDKMIRTDSLGFRDVPNNVALGSNQTGGSSGGPWLMNFGMETSFSGDAQPDDDLSNVVVATTSWGYRGASAGTKIQGASRFAKNSVFTRKSNIATLIDAACADYPWACDDD